MLSFVMRAKCHARMLNLNGCNCIIPDDSGTFFDTIDIGFVKSGGNEGCWAIIMCNSEYLFLTSWKYDDVDNIKTNPVWGVCVDNVKATGWSL